MVAISSLALVPKDLINFLGMSKYSDEQQTVILENLGLLIMKKYILEIDKMLLPTQRAEFHLLIEKNDQQAIMNFLATRVPNPQGLLMAIAQRVVYQYRGN
ncbi:MAG: hypothetical protein QM526_01425 [Alphaproteobacteria bacterium]|nr:hypothetical protein [Alphaproteobacteria bacterium]